MKLSTSGALVGGNFQFERKLFIPAIEPRITGNALAAGYY
jgi:hypothetical protein